MARTPPTTYRIGARQHLHVPYRKSKEIKDLAKAMTAGNVEAVVAIIYTTDGDTYTVWDIGRKPPFDVIADMQEVLNKIG